MGLVAGILSSVSNSVKKPGDRRHYCRRKEKTREPCYGKLGRFLGLYESGLRTAAIKGSLPRIKTSNHAV